MISIDLTSTVDRFSQALVRVRHAMPTASAGRSVPGATTLTNFDGVVIPMRGDELEREGFGTRKDSGIRIYTTTELRTVDSADGPADDVQWSGAGGDADTYQVVKVEVRHPQGQFWRATAIRRGL